MKSLFFSLLFLSLPKIYSQDLNSNLLLEYPFNGNTEDISGNNYHGINFGATYTDDRFGNPNSAILFDGINDYLNIPNVPELKPKLPVSFSFWIRYDSDDVNDRDVFNTSFEEDVNSGIYFNSQSSTGNYAINFGDGSNSYSSNSRNTFVASKTIETGVWHHIAIVVNSDSNMKIYVDCVESTGNYSGSGGNLQYSNTPGSIGRHDRDLNFNANYFKGAIDDFKYWNRELTESNIIEIFTRDINNNLLLEYSFNGNTDDTSGNNYHGTNVGAIFTNDRFGNFDSALLFDGINDYVSLPNVSNLKPNLPVSFSFWIRYDSDDVNDRDVFNTSFEEDVNSGIYFNSQSSTGNYAVNFGDGSNSYSSNSRNTFVANKTIETGVWHHIAIVVSSGSNMKIFVDCIEFEGIYSGSGINLQYSNTPGNIGRHDRDLNSSANYFKGAIDDFKYWNYELNESFIAKLCYNDETLDKADYKINNTTTVIFPNPAKNILNIKHHNSTSMFKYISIYNSLGQMVYHNEFSSSIDISHLKSGIYSLSLMGDSFKVHKKLIIK